MTESKKKMYRTWRAWCIQHPVTDGIACGVAFFIASSLLISFAFPAWAISIPITERIVINLGDLPPWIGAIVAFFVYLEARKAKNHAAEAVVVSKDLAVKVDGMLVDRDKANIKEGEQKEKIVAAEKAATLAEGQRQGRETATLTAQATPVPVVDDKVANAIERSAAATEHVAAAAENKR